MASKFDQAAAQATEEAGRQSPSVVRKGLLFGDCRLPVSEGVSLRGFSLATVLLLEEITSPILVEGGPDPTSREMAHAAFIFADPEAAAEALAQGKECFDLEAIRMATQIPVIDIPALGEKLREAIVIGTSSIPGTAPGVKVKKKQERSGSRKSDPA